MLSVAVQHQLSVLAEYSLASGAGKGKLPYMGLHVSFQVVSGDESFTTHTAVVRLLPSMNSPVQGIRETLATLDTSILLAFYMNLCAASVVVKMLLQKLLDGEALVTNSAQAQANLYGTYCVFSGGYWS